MKSAVLSSHSKISYKLSCAPFSWLPPRYMKLHVRNLFLNKKIHAKVMSYVGFEEEKSINVELEFIEKAYGEKSNSFGKIKC